jgi:hypothetical protein
MKKYLAGSFLVVTSLALGFWLWMIFFPSPEKVIRKQLHELAELASFAPNEGPLAKFANVQKLVSFFTLDVEISLDFGHRMERSLSGREELTQAAMAARNMTGLTVKFPDIAVVVAPDQQSAVVNATVRAKAQGEREDYVEELKFKFRRDGGDWLISRVEAVKTML